MTVFDAPSSSSLSCSNTMQHRNYDDPCSSSSSGRSSSSSSSSTASTDSAAAGTRTAAANNRTRVGRRSNTRSSSSSRVYFSTSTGAASMLFKLFLLLLLLLPPLASCSRLVHDKERNPAEAAAAETALRNAMKLQERQLEDKDKQGRVDFTRKPYTGNKDRDKSRRDLRSGLGSSPPQCNSKCGRCTPCKAVHVPIQPGLIRTTEYYPEAWRCKCGNKLYMP